MNANEPPNWQEVEKRATSLIDKGQLLQSVGEGEKALACFEEAARISRSACGQSEAAALMLSQSLDNKASALMDLERLDEALVYYDEAIQVYRGTVGHDGTWNDTREIALSTMNKGIALMRLGRHKEATVCLERAYGDFHRCNSTEDLARVFLNLGEVFVHQESYSLAGSCFADSILHWELAAWEATTGEAADAQSMQLLDFEDWDSAWNTVIELQPDAFKADYAYTLYLYADILQREGHRQMALDNIDRAIEYQRAIIGHVPSPGVHDDLIESVKLRGRILNNWTSPKGRKKGGTEGNE